MGHGKLKKFAENETFGCLIQPDASAVLDKSAGEGLRLIDHPIKGNWNRDIFADPQPVVLELGCGKGEYAIDLALRNPQRNYVGIDIKGARLWKGAKFVHENGLKNAAFLRTRVEFLEAFFAPGEVEEIWLTFSDPQMKSENCRLTSPLFLERYRKVMSAGGVVHLKTDSVFLHEYTKAVCAANGLEVLFCTEDLYSEPHDELPSELFEVQTFYERAFLQQGFKITYMAFRIDKAGAYAYPDFDEKYWRAVERPRLLPGAQGLSLG